MFINGDRVRINITDFKHWNDTVRKMVNGKLGTIVETSDRCRGDGGKPELKYVVEFDERAFAPPEDDVLHRGGIGAFWFPPDELEMVLAVPGERCDHAWTERSIKDENRVWSLVSMERTCSKCGKHQVADCSGGNTCGKWEDVKFEKKGGPVPELEKRGGPMEDVET